MIVVATPMFSGSRILKVPFLIFIIIMQVKVVDVCNRTEYGYSLVIIIVVPPTFVHGFRQTTAWITMKLRICIPYRISGCR